MAKKFDWKMIEKIKAGSEELHRMEMEIDTIGSILRGILKNVFKKKSERDRVISFDIDKKNILYFFKKDDKISTLLVESGVKKKEINSIPKEFVPKIHNKLPEILTRISKEFPEVEKGLDFLISQAKDK